MMMMNYDDDEKPIGDYKIAPVINAPATPEKILMSIKNIEKKL